MLSFDVLYAAYADMFSAMFWLAILCSIVFGYLWLESLVEHLSFKNGWRWALTTIFCAVAAYFLDEKISELRALSEGYSPGEGTFIVLFPFIYALIAGTLIIGPFALLFMNNPSSQKKELVIHE